MWSRAGLGGGAWVEAWMLQDVSAIKDIPSMMPSLETCLPYPPAGVLKKKKRGTCAFVCVCVKKKKHLKGTTCQVFFLKGGEIGAQGTVV